MSQNHSVEIEKLLLMRILKFGSPSSTKNSRISATSVVWSLTLIESAMFGLVTKEVSVGINRVMEIGFELPLSIRRKLQSPLFQEWEMALVPKLT